MDHGTTSEDVERLAREMFNLASSTGIWAAADYGVQLYFRKEAARRLQQARYKQRAENI